MSQNDLRDTDDLLRRARRWRDHDLDAETRTELTRLIDAAAGGDPTATADLGSRFSGPLTFGTAGLRGEVGAGESRMNVAVVSRATAGLGRYLLDTVGPDATVVIGRDARHGSAAFLAATAEVLAAQGLSVRTLPEPVPTPLLAFATRALDCDAGVMITASHNPAVDNGYKVYLGGRASDEDGRGVQIVPPTDAEIAARIADAPPADEIPRDSAVERLDDALVAAYIARTAGLRPGGPDAPSRARVVLTPLHGVGGALASTVLREAGVVDVHPVSTQFDPDPDFPTVTFPNPEEPGALDHALDLAREVNADVVIALDPDADRCAVAVPAPDGWRQLSGDELGWLLGEQAATDANREGSTLACSIVSSRMLRRIAEHHGLPFAATLTGFKWIARAPDLRFGYEEAIGYCTDPVAVRDKDGIAAMVRVVSLVDELAQQGRTLLDQLDDLARLHGLHATAPFTVRVDDTARIAEMMKQLRDTTIDTLAGTPVVEVTDLSAGSDDLPPTDAIIIRTASDDRVVIRPSGTEPKLKCYVEVILDCVDGQIPRAAAADRLARIHADLATLLDVPAEMRQ